MNESDLTRDLIKFLKQNKQLLVWKHADMFTAGIPDTEVIHASGDYHAEFKVIKGGYPELKKHIKQKRLQLEVACDVEKVGGTICYMVWYYNPLNTEPWVLEIWSPTILRNFIFHDETPQWIFRGVGRNFDTVMRYFTGAL